MFYFTDDLYKNIHGTCYKKTLFCMRKYQLSEGLLLKLNKIIKNIYILSETQR